MMCYTTKMNITFSMVNVVPNTVLKFLHQKTYTGWMKAQNQFWWDIFPHISGSIGSIVSKNNRVHPCVDPHQPCELHENQFKTVTCIVTVIIIKSWKSRSVIVECKLKNIHEVFLLESILTWKKILWRINFVLIKFLLNAPFFENNRMNVKINHFSIRLCVLSQTVAQQKCGVSFLHSWLGTIEGFGCTHSHNQMHLVSSADCSSCYTDTL